MKQERNEIIERLDNLMTGIQDTHQDLRQKTIQAQRSPAQSLRRIHSLEGGSHSYTRLDTISDCSSSSSVETSPSSTHLLQSLDSIPSNNFNTVINNSYTKSSSPNVIRRNSSSRKGSPRVLPTIPDSSVFTEDGESSSDESQNSPSQVGPLSPSKLLVQPRRSKYVWPKSTNNDNTNIYYTLPTRRSSTPNSPLHKIQFNKPELPNSFNESVWDKASVHSIDSSSMVLQISSATGQLEKVPKPMRQKLFISTKGGSSENLENSPSSLPDSSRLSVSSYFIGPGFEDSNSLIMSLSEEPAPSRSGSISSIASSRSNSVGSSYHRTNSVTCTPPSRHRESISSLTHHRYSGNFTTTTSNSHCHRNSLVLNGKETSV